MKPLKKGDSRGQKGTAKPYLKKGSPFWRIKYYVPGEEKPRYESSRSTDKNDAIRLLNQRRSEIDKRQVSSANATVSDLLHLHLDDLRRNKRSSYKDVEGYVRLHLDPAFGKVAASAITSIMIGRFIDIKQKGGLEAASINRYLSALRRSFRLGLDALPPLILAAPRIKLLDESANVREGFLEHHQYVRFREELPPHQRLILIMGYHWGMRLGELLSLRWTQIDWDENLIYLGKRQTKGNQARKAPLYGELRGFLEMAFADPARGLTIVSYQGRQITEVKTAWDKARIRAGVPVLLRHDLRRTAVRNMIRAGISQKRAMLISGHKDANVFDRYDITDERDLHEDGEKMAAYLERKSKVVPEVVPVEAIGKTGEFVN